VPASVNEESDEVKKEPTWQNGFPFLHCAWIAIPQSSGQKGSRQVRHQVSASQPRPVVSDPLKTAPCLWSGLGPRFRFPLELGAIPSKLLADTLAPTTVGRRPTVVA
jgi:hypothetical protein